MNHYSCPSEHVTTQILSQCTVCQSYSQSNFDNRMKFRLVFNILKYCFVTLRMISLFYGGGRDTSVVVTYWTDVMFYEETVPTRCMES